MKLKNIKKDELELYTFTDLAHKVLEENKKPLNTATIFKTICDLLQFTDEEYTNNVGDFYTSLITDKRFILLEDGTWDLRDRHPIKMVLDDDLDEDDSPIEEDNEDETEEKEETIDDEVDDDDLDDEEDEISELSIISDDDLEDEE